MDHAISDQRITSMQRFDSDCEKARGSPLEDYAPIVRSLVVLDEGEKAKLKRKFEICYVLAREAWPLSSIQLFMPCQSTMECI